MDEKVINNIKTLSLDMIANANSGHPGICLGAAPILYLLYKNHLKINVDNPTWINRDRFVLSAGHGSALLYSTLYMSGYKITEEDLKSFRKCNSILTGHPELNTQIGIETTTGPLGEGITNAVGMAIAEKYLEKNISKDIFSYKVYCLVGDGDLMEGLSYEAMSLAGSLKLNNLIVLYDSNDISLDGPTKNVFEDDIEKRFSASGWYVQKVTKVNDLKSINEAINNAKKEKNRPSLIEVKTIIGFDTENAGTNKVHGKPISIDEINNLKTKYGLKPKPFYVSREYKLYLKNHIQTRVKRSYDTWLKIYESLSDKDKKIINIFEGNFPIVDLRKMNIGFSQFNNKELRSVNEEIMTKLSETVPNLISGSADLFSSTKTYLTKSNDFNENFGRNIYYGVREGLMAGASNGLALSGFLPVASTFLTFSDYMKPGIRLSCLMNLPVTYVFTHDSVTIGEDGPTHQPIEQLTSLRSIPNLTVYRPCDAKELAGAWESIINKKIPACLIVSKDKLPLLKNSNLKLVAKGAYIIKKEENNLKVVLISSGADVHTAINLSKKLEKNKYGTRVISMPSVNLFIKQKNEYKEQIIPKNVKVFTIEASNDYIISSFASKQEYSLNLSGFGYSGSKDDVLKKLKFNEDKLYKKIEKNLKKN